MRGAVVAKSRKEQGTLSDSASSAELQAMVQAVNTNQVLRSIAQELAGVADECTIDAEPPGSGPPSNVHMRTTTTAMSDVIKSPPSELVGDNNSLYKRLQLDVTNKDKALRKMSRLINYIKGSADSGQIEVQLVGTKKMKANPLTKVHSSPTEHWREAEWLQGSSEELDKMKQLAKEGARGGKALVVTEGSIENDSGGYQADAEGDLDANDDLDPTAVNNTRYNAETTKDTAEAMQQARDGAREAKRRKKMRRRQEREARAASGDEEEAQTPARTEVRQELK